jgi:hypothetical protein
MLLLERLVFTENTNLIKFQRAIFFICVLYAAPSWARIFLEWTQNVVPPSKELGVNELAIPWGPERLALIRAAAAQGYHVYIDCTLGEAAGLASSAARYGAAGIIVNPGDAQLPSAERAVLKLRAAHPKFTFLLLNPNAIQPHMKGTLVINRDGVLQVTSPTAQPWLDTNLALIRLEQAFRPAQVPLYTFNWNLDGATRQQGPEVGDYELAVAEAGGLKADLILSLHENLQSGLARNDEKALARWKEIVKYLHFYASAPDNLVPEANVAVISDEDPQSFEPVNLLARHNIGMRVLRPNQVSESSLKNFDVAIVFPNLSPQLVQTISQFAASGRTAVLVNVSRKFYPWHSGKAIENGAASVSYPVEKGRVVELCEPVSDPETFARDVRGLIGSASIRISLWNALTTVGVLYQEASNGSKIVELLNYSQDPLEVQIRVKGVFPQVRYESPEGGCCESIDPVLRDGFTEFQIPSLNISGRVHLEQGKSARIIATPGT